MFRIDGSKIWLTQGDTAEFRPIIEEYTGQEGDMVYFRVAKIYSDEPVIEKVVAAGENIAIAADDTSNLSIGSYLYQLKLMSVDGNISTFATGRFMLEGDIHERTEG